MNFVIKTKPESTYHKNLNIKISSTIRLADNDKIEDQNIQKPVELIIKKSSSKTIETAKNKHGDIPATISYSDIKTSTKLNGIKTDDKVEKRRKKMFGKYINGINLEIDSIQGDNSSKADLLLANTLIDSIEQRMKFPQKKIKIGDSFKHNIPLVIPLFGKQTIYMRINRTYTLKEVNKNIALFNVKQDIELDKNIDQKNIYAKGIGNGTITYNKKEKYLTKYTYRNNIGISITGKDSKKININYKSVENSIINID